MALAGIFTGKQKKFTKKGEPYVTGTLEDLEGGIEVMIFPAVYTVCAELLDEDAVLCIRGRLDNGDTPKLIATEVTAPDVSEATGAPVVLDVAPQQCTPEIVAELHRLLGDHRGVVPVHLRLRGRNGRATTMKLPDHLCVTRSTGLYAELKRVLGPDAVR